jgi:hypothetical protein
MKVYVVCFYEDIEGIFSKVEDAIEVARKKDYYEVYEYKVDDPSHCKYIEAREVK